MGRLWRGALPLSEAFWMHAIILVAVTNLSATAVALGLLAAGLHLAAALVVWLSPAPYVVVAVVGVWRSASAAGTGQTMAMLARWTAAFWGLAMVIL